MIEPAAAGVDLVDWARGQRDELRSDLVKYGAILFRGFGVTDAEVFEALAVTLCDELFNENGEHPRETVDGNVYTPTFYPADHKLLWHNENSFNHRWPTKILFCCLTPPEQGGETPLVDSRRVLAELDPEVRERFVARGVTYMRNYHPGLGLSWQEVFQTSDRREVERRCREDRIEADWVEETRLRTRARRPAVVAHPVTGELTWFNQAQHWHVSCLDAQSRESMESLFSEDELPRNCYYGDDSTIADEDMQHVLDVYDRLEISFPWQRGDVILVDNVLVAHARNPYQGKRKLLVSLGDMGSYDEQPAVAAGGVA
ncbi:MAG TPA: TauD/TfdA family dioxygenase [Thermoanaerobaculia bacterium]|nr:TauD/TfdA family dioxygenase [Thermoanaerobaculia bacterium]